MDEIVTSPGEKYVDRFGNEHYTIEGTRQNLIPLSRQYMTLADAQADIANIPEGSTTYYRSPDDSVLAIEVINSGGVLQPTGRIMPGNAALSAPNLIQNSRADSSADLPALLNFDATAWGAPSAAMSALGAVQSVTCPPRGSSTDPIVDYVFQFDVSFVNGGSYIATEFLFRGDTSLVFSRLLPDEAVTRLTQRVELVSTGIYRVTSVWKVNGYNTDTASVIYWGCQQKWTSTDDCEIAYPKIAISDRAIFGVGGDLTPADYANSKGMISPNQAFNPSADPAFQLQPLYTPDITAWAPVSSLPTAVQAIASYGAKSAIAAPRVSSGYKDALTNIPLDMVKAGDYLRVEFGVYVAADAGVSIPAMLASCQAFIWTGTGSSAVIVPATVKKKLTDNIYIMTLQYRLPADGIRVNFGVRNTRTNVDYYVFNTKLATESVPISEISNGLVRDSLMPQWIEALSPNAPNIAFNPSADPAQQLQPLFGSSTAWTPVASLPAAVQAISALGAKSSLPCPRVTTGSRDALVNISLDGVKAGQYVRIEFGMYANFDAGTDLPTILNCATAFFWYGTTFQQKTAVQKRKVSENIYIMTYEFQMPEDAVRVYFGVRNTRQVVDYWVFNTKCAVASKTITNIADWPVRDPLLSPWVDSKIANSSAFYPPFIAVDTPITKAEDFILLPDRIFVHPTQPQIIQAHQLLMNWTADMGQFLDWSVRGTDVNGRPYAHEFNRDIELDPAKIGTAVSFGFNNRQKPNQWSRRDVTLVRGPAALSGTKTVALIGDSLTNRGQVNRVTALLTAAGLNVNQVGTMAQNEGGKGEGREGWAAAHFVGKRTLNGSNRITISADNPSSTLKNPFLFEATTAQKTASPAMCFLNTGAASELSYADTQTGTFYTFDYRRYLDQQGFADPDVVSIALAWNDQAIGTTPADYIAQINYLVSQIKTACPNAQVAVAPYSPPYSSRGQWNNTISQYVRNVIGSFRNRAAEGVHIIPAWGIMPSDTAWSSDGSSVTVDPQTGSYVDTRSDNIHWDTFGRQYMAYNCLYPFYSWACSQ
ncbi:SGNH/GDSL hydrolase family protein [Klebsiella aerogenes]